MTNSDEEVNKRMYDEVKNARMISTSLKSTNALFRFKKSDKNLSTEEYVDDLNTHIYNTRSCENVTIEDLRNIIHC